MIEEKKPKANRKSLSQKTRFEVFKRDSFTCQYCGGKAPDVLLEADHIKPVSKGGTNAILNLITSCWSCNSGKSDRELSDGSVLDKQRKQLEQMNERRQLIEMMMKWHESLANESKFEADQSAAYFLKAVGSPGSITENGKKVLQGHIKKYGLKKVLEAIDIIPIKYPSLDLNEQFNKIKGVLYYNDSDETEKHAMYIRGVIKNRFGFLDKGEFEMVKKVLDQFEYDYVLGIAKGAHSFYHWKLEMDKLQNA